MPDWQPQWQDVAFDHGACADAVAACRNAARELDLAADALVTAGDQAQDDWTGATRTEFADAASTATGEQRDLIDQLEALASALEAGAESAIAEQGRRERERERWHQEAAAERAAERARQEEARRLAAGGPV